MKLQLLMDKLLRAGRTNSPSDAVPYAFEQRVMARIRSAKPQDVLGMWGAALWRAAMACLLLTLLSGAWSVWSAHSREVDSAFSQEFETALVMPEFDEAW